MVRRRWQVTTKEMTIMVRRRWQVRAGHFTTWTRLPGCRWQVLQCQDQGVLVVGLAHHLPWRGLACECFNVLRRQVLQCQGQGVLVVGLGHDLAWRGLAARLALRLRLRYKSKILHQTQIFVGNEMKPPSSHRH